MAEMDWGVGGLGVAPDLRALIAGVSRSPLYASRLLVSCENPFVK
jgi:hypothetical protein